MTKRSNTNTKTELHNRNKHRNRYDFKQLISSLPALEKYIEENKYGDLSIDFFNPNAVKHLNKALLFTHYGLDYWDIPDGYLCPPIPGRADYIHHIADLIGKRKNTTCLDIGVGANCIYPIIGVSQYNWKFIGSDIDSTAIKNAKKIVASNPILEEKVALRLQNNAQHIFEKILKPTETIDVVICNPPFHSSQKEAQSSSSKKVSNLKKKHVSKADLNFGGQSNELWCKGGELKFIGQMIDQSKKFAEQCNWFTTLVSKSSNERKIYNMLKEVKAKETKTIPMSQGNKVSRIIAWRF